MQQPGKLSVSFYRFPRGSIGRLFAPFARLAYLYPRGRRTWKQRKREFGRNSRMYDMAIPLTHLMASFLFSYKCRPRLIAG